MKKSMTPIGTVLTVPRPGAPRPTRTDTPAAKRRSSLPVPIPREESNSGTHQCVSSACSQFGSYHEHDSAGSSPIVEVLNPSMAPPPAEEILVAECPTLQMPIDWQKQFINA